MGLRSKDRRILYSRDAQEEKKPAPHEYSIGACLAADGGESHYCCTSLDVNLTVVWK